VSDESFREIQLNGKQLIFLVMAATVFSVVVFLFGVLVGRNARTGPDTVESAATEIAPDPVLPPITETAAPAPAAGGAAAEGSTAKPAEDLSYAERLLRDAPAEEHLKTASSAPPREAPASQAPASIKEPVASKDAVAAESIAKEPPAKQPPVKQPAPKEPVAAAPPPPRPAAATPPPPPVEATAAVKTAAAGDPSGPGFAVQVAAYKDRKESDSLAKQLIAKGYPAFVLDPVKGAPTAFYRVRVGKYKTRQEAQAIMAKLQSEQYSNAWIAR
jgi:cell division protein FtsN